ARVRAAVAAVRLCREVDDLLIEVDGALRHHAGIAPAVIDHELAAVRLEVAQIRIDRVQHAEQFRVDDRDVLVEVERAPIPLRIAEAHAAEHRGVDRERLLAVHDHAPARITGLRTFAATLEARIDLLARARISRALVDLLERLHLTRIQALIGLRGRARERARLEAAGARVGENAVGHAVGGVAL